MIFPRVYPWNFERNQPNLRKNKKIGSDGPPGQLFVCIFDFLKENNVQIKDLRNIFVHQGPGKFSSIRSSIAVAKGISVANSLDLYGFNGDQVEGHNYSKMLLLFKKGELKKNLIKPHYLS